MDGFGYGFVYFKSKGFNIKQIQNVHFDLCVLQTKRRMALNEKR